MGGWEPWRELRRRDHIDFRLASGLPHGLRALYWPRGERVAIVIDRALGRRERRAALAHELVHDERGGGCSCPPDAHQGLQQLARKDEVAVLAEVARRLVPEGELRVLIERLTELGEGVTAQVVADEFDTTLAVAQLALELMRSAGAR